MEGFHHHSGYSVPYREDRETSLTKTSSQTSVLSLDSLTPERTSRRGPNFERQPDARSSAKTAGDAWQEQSFANLLHSLATTVLVILSAIAEKISAGLLHPESLASMAVRRCG